jgi:hypothetical protein
MPNCTTKSYTILINSSQLINLVKQNVAKKRFLETTSLSELISLTGHE